ncbi:MAG: hypothetical protein J0I52_03005 [Bordetella sp.]|nr:hypothetical protein [Bordetella sp.]
MDVFIVALRRHGLDGAQAPILIQCFEAGMLERLATRVQALAPSSLTARPHAAGLKVAVWTLHAENLFLLAQCRIGAAPRRPGCLSEGRLRSGRRRRVQRFSLAAVQARR